MLIAAPDWQSWTALWNAALAGMAEPWIVCAVLALTTLLLEDVAIAAGAAVATQGLLSWGASFGAVAGGIAAGDLGLYALGLASTRSALLRRRVVLPALPLREPLIARLASAVLVARVVPGLRLVTYTACGLLRVPLAAFSAWVALAVTLWTAGLYALSAVLGEAIARALGIAPALAVAASVVAIALAIPLARSVRNRLQGGSR